jgi:hypothetical protein
MTKEEARAFIGRWQIVEQYIVEEIRNLTPELRAGQIAAAYQTGRAMGLASEEVPFQEWQRLREKFDGR